MQVLVTGGAGFIGSHIAEFFASNGYTVTVYDNLTRSQVLAKDHEWSDYNWNYLAKKFNNIKLVKADIRDHEKFEQTVKGIDIIIHTAAQVAVTTSVADPLTDFMINAYGTLNILEAARKADSKVIFLSTNKVYGERVNRIPMKIDGNKYVFTDNRYLDGIPEDFPVDGTVHTPYGCSKLAADLYVQDYTHVYGIETAVLRLSCIYGERQFGVEDQGWLAHFVRQALTNNPITIYGDGKQVRDVLYVGDLVKAVYKVSQNMTRIRGEVFNIGGGPANAISLLEAINYIEKLNEKKIKIEFRDWRPADQRIFISNVSKAKEKLRWSPETRWTDGIQILFGWMKSVFTK